MDDRLLEELIEDYERMLGIISSRLLELKAMRKGERTSITRKNSVKDMIEAKRKEIMAQVDAAPRNAPINRSKKKDA